MNISDLTNAQWNKKVNLKGLYYTDMDGELRDCNEDWVVTAGYLISMLQVVEKRKIEYMEAEIKLRKKLQEALEE